MKKNTLDVNELINSVKNGDYKSKEKIYKIYKETVYRFLIRKYPKNYDVEDDTSEIMIKVFESIEKYDSSKSKFNTWVINIANNHMIDKSKKRKLDKISINNDTYGILSLDVNYNTSNSALDSMNYCSTLMSISNQINDSDCFDMIQMKYSGYTYNEIAQKYSLNSNQVSNKLNYIKTKIKEH